MILVCKGTCVPVAPVMHPRSGVPGRYPPTPSNLQKRRIWVFYNIPPNFKLKYWQENFIWEKNHNIH